MQAMPASVGLLMPSALVLSSSLWGDDRLLQATCLVPYIGTLLSQIWMEGHFTKQGRPCLLPSALSQKQPAAYTALALPWHGEMGTAVGIRKLAADS